MWVFFIPSSSFLQHGLLQSLSTDPEGGHPATMLSLHPHPGKAMEEEGEPGAERGGKNLSPLQTVSGNSGDKKRKRKVGLLIGIPQNLQLDPEGRGEGQLMKVKKHSVFKRVTIDWEKHPAAQECPKDNSFFHGYFDQHSQNLVPVLPSRGQEKHFQEDLQTSKFYF